MARDRQRAKRRQAERRAERLQDGDGASRADRTSEPAPDPVAEAQIAAAAPPEDAGRSDTVVEAPPPVPDLAGEDQPDGRPRAGGEPRERERGRVGAFLAAVVAELQRVQWPDRKTLVTLTGVVLGFVVIMGVYLGGLDAVFSRIVELLL